MAASSFQISSLLHPPGSALSTESFLHLYGTSVARHSSISAIVWAIAVKTDRAEAKDWLWPSGMLFNTWWSVLAPGLSTGTALTTILQGLGWREKVLLFGVNACGLRLFYHIASRSVKRGGDDPRYVAAKKAPGFWKQAFFRVFLPEAACFQALITLPFVAPFMPGVRGLLSAGPWGVSDSLAVGLFGMGFAIEAAADWQLESHKKSGDTGLLEEGAWSIVRHPNYLGDALAHMAFPLLLWDTPVFHPLVLLGPLANYLFLRYIGGDNENESSQRERYEKTGNQEKMLDLQKATEEKNSFWPAPAEVKNPWLWKFVGLGAITVVVEEAVRRL